MKFVAFALLVIGYAAFYSGASNLMTGGNGWGFMESLLNKGSGNAALGGVGAILGGGSTTPSSPATQSTPVGGGGTIAL